MISVEEVAKILGTRPEFIRKQIILNKTPFKAWCFRTPARRYRYLIPRRPFEDWIFGTDGDPFDFDNPV